MWRKRACLRHFSKKTSFANPNTIKQLAVQTLCLRCFFRINDSVSSVLIATFSVNILRGRFFYIFATDFE